MTPGVSEGRCLVGVLIIVGFRSQKFSRIFFTLVVLSKIFQNFFYFSSMKATHDFNPKDKVNRPGIHAKTKTSKNKKSKLYKKAYRGQGR
jgi:hypothetical protein